MRVSSQPMAARRLPSVAGFGRPRYASIMGVRATVRNGRLTVDQPVDLPEGTVLDLVIDDEGDQLDEREREALNAAISRSLRESAEGRTAPAEEIIQKLRERRDG